MKPYLIVTGALFGAVGIAHLLRLFVEPGHAITDLGWIGPNLLLFVVGGGVAAWSIRLYRRLGS